MITEDQILAKVMQASRNIEYFISLYLCKIFSIDYDVSKAFGNRSGALSLNSKVILLTDIKFLEKSELPKVQVFLEIRNQFAHNREVVNFKTCFFHGKDCEQKLKKWYAHDLPKDLQDEEEASLLFDMLYNNLDEILKEMDETGRRE
ncbi:MAG: hypothetical protein WKF89_15795 [Chitinophagaceae bacterium]